MADEKDTGPFIPKGTDEGTDEENTVIDTTSAKPLREAKIEEPNVEESREEPNPPRTTKGFFTAPKFGSAGSGGAEFEPGPERD
ncbi:MAG: hypothetical protein H7062_00520 [Candidatus Saccharimonas sp.]|nr:hypothetical protein [Planctomycetaceae bacterium]